MEKINEDLTRCKVYVHGVGKNRNRTHISKDSSENATYSLDYLPVVGHLIYKEDEDGNGRYVMGGHDCKIDWNTLDIKSICVPYGVVVPNTYDWEDVEEYGQVVTYRTADIILWTGRYPELKEAVYSDDIWFNQSMEIEVMQSRDYEEDGIYEDLVDWKYSALCLLGKSDNPEDHTEPCFISSCVKPLTYSLDFSTELNEFKNLISEYIAARGGDSMEQNTEINKPEFDEANTEETQTPVVPKTEDEAATENNEAIPSDTETEEVEMGTREANSTASELEALRNAFDEYKSNHTYLNTDVELIQQQLAVYEKEKKQAILSDEAYTKLKNSEEYKDITAGLDKYSASELQSKLDLLLGQKARNESYSASQNNVQTYGAMLFSNVNENETEDRPYASLFK